MLKLEQLRILSAIAVEGSIARAGKSLHLSVPTVTTRINSLERSVGVELVQRSPRGAQLTPAGERLLLHAQAVFKRLDAAEQDLAEFRRQDQRAIRIGAFSTAASVLLPAALRQLLAQDDVRVELIEGEVWELTRQLDAGLLHGAVLYSHSSEPLPDLAHVQQLELHEEPFELALAANHPLAGQNRVDLAQLQDAAWIRSRHDLEPTNLSLLDAAELAGFFPRTLLRTDDYGVILGLVAAGLGVAVVPASVVGARDDVVSRPVLQPLGGRQLHYGYRVSQGHARAAELGQILQKIGVTPTPW